jgi:hypothetical protein
MAPGDFSGSYFLGARAAPENPLLNHPNFPNIQFDGNINILLISTKL